MLHLLAQRVVGVRSALGPDGGIALTFDDGPDPVYTPRLLDMLRAHGAQATFFVTGAAALAHPDLVHRITADGHSVGSHSLTHPFVADQRFATIYREYRHGRRALEKVTGSRCRLFRPPGSDVGFRSLAAMALNRLRPWLWTVDTEDWRPGRTPAEIGAALARARPGDVVIMHDGIELPEDDRARDRSASLAAVDAFLREVHGHRFVAVPR